MPNRDVHYIKANPGSDYVLGQVLSTAPENSIWTDKDTGAEDANSSGMNMAVTVLDLTQAVIDDIPSDDVNLYKVNDVNTPTSVVLI